MSSAGENILSEVTGEDETQNFSKTDGVIDETESLTNNPMPDIEKPMENKTALPNICNSRQVFENAKIKNGTETELISESTSSDIAESEKNMGYVETCENKNNLWVDELSTKSQNDYKNAIPETKTDDIYHEATSFQQIDEYENQSIYCIKWIKYQDNTLPIITQNENGPCPLLAIMNYLLLQKKIVLPPSTELVTSNNLISYLADYLFEHVPKNIDTDNRLNYEQKMNDAMAMFPKLQTGLDVNIRFTGVNDFEYTTSSEVFDLLEIPLYHGWLVDPENLETEAAIGNATYNQLVDKIINWKSSSNSEEALQAIVAEEFLNNTASQITYHGLGVLSSTLQDSQMGVLFRNNHFHTLLKHNGELYVLATDHGFLHEPGVVWETLSNVEGDSHFVNAGFVIFQQSASKSSVQPTSFANTKEQINQDYLVALTLQREQNETADQCSLLAAQGLTDHQIAMKLQEQENKLAESAPTATDRHQPTGQQRQRVSAVSSSSVTKDKKSLCSIM